MKRRGKGGLIYRGERVRKTSPQMLYRRAVCVVAGKTTHVV